MRVNGTSGGKTHLLGTDKLLAKDVTKQRITQDDSTKIRERLTTSTKLEDLGKVDFVIEAVPVRYVLSCHQTRLTLL